MKRKKFLTEAAVIGLGALGASEALGASMNVSIDVSDPDGQNLQGIVTVTVTAGGGSLRSVQLQIDGNVVASGTGSPLVYQWNTNFYADGTHILRGVAQYKTRQSTAQLAVTVNNAATTTKPSIPTGLVATPGTNQVSLQWNANPASEQVDVYQVYLDDQFHDLNVVGTSFVVAGLAAGSTHTFPVSAHNSFGYGDWTDPISVTVPGGTSPGRSPLAVISYAFTQPWAHMTDYDMRLIPSWSNPSSYGPSMLHSAPLSVPASRVSHATASANGWLATRNGQPMGTSPYGQYLADINSNGYRDAYISATIAACQSGGFAGVMNDEWDPNNVLGLWGGPCDQYPSVSAAHTAMVNFMAYVGPRLRSAGITHGYNSWYNNGDTGGFFNQIGTYADFIMIETWMWGEHPWNADPDKHCRVDPAHPDYWFNNWEFLIGLIANANARNCRIFALRARNTDTIRNYAYPLASFMLEWDPNVGGGFATAPQPVYASAIDPWNTVFDEALLLGNPSGPKVKSGTEYSRQYQGGIVKVDPQIGTWQIGRLS